MVLKFGINQNGETLYYLEKLTLPLDSQTVCFLFDVQTVVELRLQQKPHFTMDNFEFRGLSGVENFCTKLPKGTPLRQIWSNRSFGVCGSDVVLTQYCDEKKSTRFRKPLLWFSITLAVALTYSMLLCAFTVWKNLRFCESANAVVETVSYATF